MTKNGYETLHAELHRLKTVERPKTVKEIEEARAHGDLSENAEYHAAKEKQGLLEGRIREYEDRLAQAQVIDPATQDTSQVRFGCTVVLMDINSDEEVSYTIVGEDEANAAQGKISIHSPVARALLGKELDSEVTVRVPKGTREFEVREIRIDL